jgi:hypothetical protein
MILVYIGLHWPNMFLLKVGNGNMPQMGGCNGLPKMEDAVRGCAMHLQRPHCLKGDIAQWNYH